MVSRGATARAAAGMKKEYTLKHNFLSKHVKTDMQTMSIAF